MLHACRRQFLIGLPVLNNHDKQPSRTFIYYFVPETKKRKKMERKSTFNRVLLTVGLSLCALNLQAQKNSFWQNAASEQGGALATAIAHSRTVSVNVSSLRTYLNTADILQAGKSIHAVTKTTDWAFPLPDGSSVAVKVVRNKTLSDVLAAQNPMIKTYTGYNAEGIPCMRLTVSPIGAAGFINTEKGQVYLAPVKGNPSLAVSFYTKDLKAISGTIQCGTEELEHLPSEGTGEKPLGFVDNQMRDYTISIAATGEYTTWAGSQANALATITTSINNVNAVYERDLAVHFTLNSPNSILFTVAGSDPYSSGGLSSTQLNQNQTAVDLAIGTANYDLSVVFNAGWSGGLAQLSSTCNATGKARSAAGLDPAVFSTGPSGPVFDMTVAHEVGHQFAATHSFSANTGGCNGNVTGTTAWEPGGGSTIMAYAGTCTGLAYQSNSDSYFHGGNLGQMSVFLLTGGGSSCATLSPLTDALPLLNKIAYSYTIPFNTPFKLRAPAADANADILTYCWEQLNPFGGTGTNALPSPTATSGPLFRSFPPTTEPTRYFPNLPEYAAGTATPYEVLPTVARTMNFLLTVRDNHTGAGATDTQNITVNVSTCGSFAITSHTTASAATGGSSTTLTWNTAAACVTCNNIDVLFSKDGGKTFPYTVLSGTPNDGSQSVTIPNVNTCDGRFMIACSDNIFYNINSGAISVTTSCLADGATISPATSISAPQGSASLNLTTMNPVYGSVITTPITGSITTANPSSSVAVFNNSAPCINFNGNIVRYTTYTITPSVTGSYIFNASGSTASLVYSLYNDEYLPAAPCQNMIACSGNYNGTAVTLNGSVTATLCAQKKYVLLISSFNGSIPALPASYTIAVSGPAGFVLYNNVPPPTGYNYVYNIINNATGNIVDIAAAPDLSNATNYPTGNYTIYGVSTNTTAVALDATYGGGSLAAFNTASNNGTICANISSNSRSVQISTPLPLDLTAFSAKLLSATVAGINWTVAKENNIAKYELQRSYNAMDFELITTVLPGVQDNTVAAYSYTDDKFNRSENQLFYRLKISEQEGQVKYSNIEKLLLDRTKDFSLQVSPNPIQYKEVYFNLTTPQSGAYSISIIDETGRVLYVKTQNFTTGINHCIIPAESLSKGIYYLKVQGSNGVLNARFVKL
jgi:hypothetical protein